MNIHKNVEQRYRYMRTMKDGNTPTFIRDFTIAGE